MASRTLFVRALKVKKDSQFALERIHFRLHVSAGFRGVMLGDANTDHTAFRHAIVANPDETRWNIELSESPSARTIYTREFHLSRFDGDGTLFVIKEGSRFAVEHQGHALLQLLVQML